MALQVLAHSVQQEVAAAVYQVALPKLAVVVQAALLEQVIFHLLVLAAKTLCIAPTMQLLHTLLALHGVPIAASEVVVEQLQARVGLRTTALVLQATVQAAVVRRLRQQQLLPLMVVQAR